MIESTLKQLNLAEKEIKIYLAMLQLGQSTINRISEVTAIPKSTCYDIIKSLMNRGLASSFIEEKVAHFEAADPHVLLANLEEQKQKVKEVLPELINMRKSIGEKPNVELYSGKIGIKSIFDRIIENGTEFRALTNENKFAHMSEWFIQQFRMRRKKRNIHAKVMSEDSETSQRMRVKDKEELRLTKIKSFMNNQDAECYVFGDYLAFVTLSEKEPTGVLIENKQIADLQRALFEQVWKSN